MITKMRSKLNGYWDSKIHNFFEEKHTSQWKTSKEFIDTLSSGVLKIKGFTSRFVNRDGQTLKAAFSHDIEKSKYCIEITYEYASRMSIVHFYFDGYSITKTNVKALHSHLGAFLNHLDDFIKEYNELTPRLIAEEQEEKKQKKINAIAEKSIEVWLDAICKDIAEPYYIRKDKNKILFSVQLKNKTQIDIPINYSSFRKIMPEILNAIKYYRKVEEEAPIKASISHCSMRVAWKRN